MAIAYIKRIFEELEKDSKYYEFYQRLSNKHDPILSKPSVWFDKNCNFWYDKVSREDKYLMPNDRKLIVFVKKEALRLVSLGDYAKADEITKPIYERYIQISHNIEDWESSCPYLLSILDEDYANRIMPKDANERKLLHDEDIFPIDMDDLSYITDFCKFYEEDIAPYQMLYGIQEDKSTTNEYGHLEQLTDDREKKYYPRAVSAGYAKEIDDGFLWLGKVSRLGYFLSRVYDASYYTQKPMSRLKALWWVNKDGSLQKIPSLSANISKAPQKGDKTIRSDVQEWVNDMEQKLFFD